MAVIVSNGATSLSTVNGFYRAEAFNLGCYSNTALTLNVPRTIGVTFATAGNCQGLILCVQGVTVMDSHTRTLTVELQEFVAGSWVTRASVTYDKAAMFNVPGSAAANGFIVPFTGGTFPYAVTTAAATWRFQLSQSAGAFDWSVRTSDGTNPFYVTWCDNAVTFASNDCIVCKDTVTVDMTATLKGVLGTGDSTRSTCAVLCRSTTPTVATVAKLEWQNPPAAAYTLTIDGFILTSSASGIRIGSEGAPIPITTPATLSIIGATSGGTNNSGFALPAGLAGIGVSYFFHGEYPAVQYAELAAPAATGQPNIVTTAATGWALNDRVLVGGASTKGGGDGTIYTVSSSAGTTVTLASNLTAVSRSTKGRVVKLNGYSVNLLAPTTVAAIVPTVGITNWQMSGVYCRDIRWSGNSGYRTEFAANYTAMYVRNSAFEISTTTGHGAGPIFNAFGNPYSAFDISDNVFGNCSIAAGLSNSNGDPDPKLITVQRNINVRLSFTGGGTGLQIFGYAAVKNNVWESSFNGPGCEFNAANGEFTGNRIWGVSDSISGVRFSSTINCVMGQNAYENCNWGIRFQGVTINCVDTGSIFGQEVANSAGDVGVVPGGIINYTLESPVGALSILFSVAATNISSNGAPGSHLRITNYNGTANNDIGFLRFGKYQRTGAGLTDTTARTAGGYALRMEPGSASRPLEWPNLTSERAIPTGNIQSKTMTVTAWVYINDAAYYAGTHTKPTLSVKYDNTTTATAVATATAGSWQQLAVTFTPATTYGQIEVWFAGATDATGANAYFYVDDVQVAYPAGVSINLGGLDLWANATPVWPPIATFPSLGSVWDEPVTAHTVAGSFGEALSAGSGGGATAQDVWEYPSRTLVPIGGVTNLY